MAGRKKQEVITFKVDRTMAKAMRGVANRSEFIREAILNALDNVCPLCCGSGSMTPDQRRHWEQFSGRHSVKKCKTCRATHLVCDLEKGPPNSRGAR